MANIIQRITTWAAGQVLKSADLNGEFNNVVNLFNNLNSASTSWNNITATGTVVVPNASASNQAMAYGQNHVFQVLQGTTSSPTSTSSTTFVTTGLTAAITPTSSSSKILIMVNGSVIWNNTTGAYTYISVERGSTDLSAGNGFTACAGKSGGNPVPESPCSFVYLDSPATTSATTYTVTMKVTNGASTGFIGETDGAVSPLQTIILMEVQ